MSTIDDAARADAERIAAAERLVQLRPADAAVVDLVMQRVGGRSSPERSAGFIAALGLSSAAEAPVAILDRLAALTPPLRETAVRTVLANREWAVLLVDRLERRSVSLGDIPLADRAKLTDHPDRRLRDRAKKVLAAGSGSSTRSSRSCAAAATPTGAGSSSRSSAASATCTRVKEAGWGPS